MNSVLLNCAVYLFHDLFVTGTLNRCPDGFIFWEVSRRCELDKRIAKKCGARSRDVMAWNLSVDMTNVGRRSRQLLRLEP
jgi:hypothetical protein